MSRTQTKRHLEWLDHLVEPDRIQKDGPTLKIVTENFRSTISCAIVLYACFVCWTETRGWLLKPFVLFWGAWAGLYLFVSFAQSILIVITGLFRIPLFRRLFRRLPEWTHTPFAALMAFAGMVFTLITLMNSGFPLRALLNAAP